MVKLKNVPIPIRVSSETLGRRLKVSNQFDNSTDNKRLKLTYYLNIIGIAFLLTFGLITLLKANYSLASILFTSISLGLINIRLLHTRFKNFAPRFLAVISFLTALYLFASGGAQQTGYFWTFPLVALGIAVLRFVEGCLYCALYMISSLFIFLSSESAIWIVNYSHLIGTRYLVSMLALFAMVLTIIKLQEEAYKQLRTLAVTDGLTDLLNRTVMEKRKFKEDILSFEQNVYLLLVDIDHFKSINDTFGHNMGDKVLVRVAHILKEQTRRNDYTLRWGGEEFLVILRGCNEQSVLIKAEEIRVAIENDHELCKFLSRPVTASIGVSTLQKEIGLDESLHQADINLYEAKERGRNRVIFV